MPRHSCAYCGGPTKGGLDHVPALSKAAKLPIEKLTDGTTRLSLVPACFSCNMRAGSTGATVAERRTKVGRSIAWEIHLNATVYKNRFDTSELERKLAWNEAHQADPEPKTQNAQTLAGFGLAERKEPGPK